MRPDHRVFISYSSQDRTTAETFHRALGTAGLDVWRDQTRLESNWSREIAEALVASDVVGLIWTAHAAQSRWVQHEWLTGRALGVTVLPCMLPGAPPLPKALENIHAVVAADAGTLANLFIERVRAGVSEPAYDYTVRPERFEVPFRPIPHFVGREADLVDLYLSLIGDLNNTGTRAVGLVGMGGTGKTQLVVEFAWRFAYAFSGTYWLDAVDASRWRAQFVDLARRVKAPVADATTSTEEQWLAALTQYCHEHPGTLLILDNVDDPSTIAEALPGTDFTPLDLGCNLLFTTRRHVEFESSIVMQELGMLPEDGAYALLTAGRPPETNIEVESARTIVNALGYLPLAIVLAAAYISRLNRTYRTYTELLKQHGLDAIDTAQATKQVLATRHEAAVGHTLDEQWRAVHNDNARLLLKLAGQLPESAFIPSRRLEIFSGLGPGKTELELPFDEALNDLRDLSLIELHDDRKSVALHPLVRDFARRQVDENNRGTLQAEAAARMARSYAVGERLEHEYEERGIDDVLGDLEAACSWMPLGDDSGKALEDLRELIAREQHTLRLEEDLDVPRPRLFQQLQHRAMLMGREQTALLQDLQQSQTRHRIPVFITRAVTTSDDPALIGVIQVGDPIADICLLNDGEMVLCASPAGLSLWDAESGELLQSYLKHSLPVTAVQVTAEGAHALSASEDRTLILWDLKTAEPLKTLVGHKTKVRALSMTPDGRYALSADDDGLLIWWDLDKGEVIDGFRAPQSISSLSLSPDGSAAVSGWDLYAFKGFKRDADDLALVLLDLQNRQINRSLRGIGGIITAIDADWPRGVALVGSAGGSSILSDLKTGESLKHFPRAPKWVNSVSLLPGGEFVLTGTEDGLLLLWETKDQSDDENWTPEWDDPIRAFAGHGGAVTAIRVTSNGERAFTGSYDGTVIVWNLRAVEKAALRHHVGDVLAVCMSEDGTRALSGAQDSSLILWDVETGSPIRKLEGHHGAVARASMSEDGRRATTNAFSEGYALVWDVENAKVTHRLGIQLGPQKQKPPTVLSSTMSRDGSLVLTSTAPGELLLWDLKTNPTRFHIIQRDRVMKVGLAISADQSRFALGWDETKVVVCNMSGSVVAELPGHTGLVWCGALSENGSIAVTGARDHTVIIWDVDKGFALHQLKAHHGNVMAVVLSADAKRLLSASMDKTVILWDVESGRAINRMVFESPVLALGWRGDRIVLGQGGGAVSFLELKTDA